MLLRVPGVYSGGARCYVLLYARRPMLLNVSTMASARAHER